MPGPLQGSGCILVIRFSMHRDLRVQRFEKVSFCPRLRKLSQWDIFHLVVVDTKHRSQPGSRASGFPACAPGPVPRRSVPRGLCPAACAHQCVLSSLLCSPASAYGTENQLLREKRKETNHFLGNVVLKKSRAGLKFTAGWC